MSENKHIPGPWWVTDSLGDGGGHTVRAVDPADGFRFQVCEVWGIDDDRELDERSLANTCLIAAAPKLLEAVERQCDNMAFILNHNPMTDSLYDKFIKELEQDRSIITKATGDPE
jgi:hypothetical protein